VTNSTDAIVEQSTRVEPISMIRSTPPTAPGLEDAVRLTLREISNGSDQVSLVMKHRFGGTDHDKDAALRWFASRSMTRVTAERITLVNSAQNAMILALSELLRPGDTLAVERLSYHGLRKIAHLLGIRIVSIEMDRDGADPDAFRRACRSPGVRALYLMPTLHNPTSSIMSLPRRLELAQIARENGVSIVEDDVYAPLPRSAPAPFAELAPDVTWYLTSFAKCIGPGLRVGYLVAPTADAARRLRERLNGISTWFPAPISAEFVRRWLDDGTMEKFTSIVRMEAEARQLIATEVLGNYSYITQAQSLFLWLDLPSAWTQDELVAEAANHGVIIRPGYTFVHEDDEAPHALRVVLGSPDTAETLREGLSVLTALLSTVPGEKK